MLLKKSLTLNHYVVDLLMVLFPMINCEANPFDLLILDIEL